MWEHVLSVPRTEKLNSSRCRSAFTMHQQITMHCWQAARLLTWNFSSISLAENMYCQRSYAIVLSNNLCFIDSVRLVLTNLWILACGKLPASSFTLPSLESWQWLKIRHIQVELLIVTNENFTLHWLPRPSDYLLLVILVHWHSWVMCVPIGSLTQNCHCKGIVKRARQSPTSVKPWQHCSSGHNPT